MVVCLLYTGRIHGPRFTIQGSRRSGSPPVTGCAHLCTLVQGSCSKGAQRKSLIYMSFNQSVRVVRVVQAFSSSFSHVNALLILSSKLNFDSKKGAQCAQITLAPATVSFQQFQKVHRYAHSPCTDPLLSAQTCKIIDPNDKKPRFIDLDSRFTLIGRFYY